MGKHLWKTEDEVGRRSKKLYGTHTGRKKFEDFYNGFIIDIREIGCIASWSLSQINSNNNNDFF